MMEWLLLLCLFTLSKICCPRLFPFCNWICFLLLATHGHDYHSGFRTTACPYVVFNNFNLLLLLLLPIIVKHHQHVCWWACLYHEKTVPAVGFWRLPAAPRAGRPGGGAADETFIWEMFVRNRGEITDKEDRGWQSLHIAHCFPLGGDIVTLQPHTGQRMLRFVQCPLFADDH